MQKMPHMRSAYNAIKSAHHYYERNSDLKEDYIQPATRPRPPSPTIPQ